MTTGFEPVYERTLLRYDCRATLWRHASGLHHLHLASDDTHRGCCLAFRTLAEDDRGLPHALEHLVLCGSHRFPVRDPYFGMHRRSLQTWLNALTGDDATLYAFATTDPTDFHNLLAVYLDACFHPLLREVDLDREVWHLDPESGQLEGVILNEMRGAMAEPETVLDQAVMARLLPDTNLRWNAGGDPAAIPGIDLAALQAAHRRWYRPANALLTTYGDLDPSRIQHEVAAQLPSEPGVALAPPLLQSPREPERAEVAVEVDPDDDPTDARIATIAWAWGDSTDTRSCLEGALLDRLLLGHAAAPLRLALEGCGLLRAIAHSGFSDRSRSSSFALVLHGIAEGALPAIEDLVERELQQLAEHGLGAEAVETARRQLAFEQRCIGDAELGFGLDLCMRSCDAWALGEDPIVGIDREQAFARLLATDAAALGRELPARLAANRHRVSVITVPSPGLGEEREAAEAAVVASLRGVPSDWPRRLSAIADWQREPDRHELLPGLGRDNLPRVRRRCEPELRRDGVAAYTAPCVGLLHQVAVLPLPELEPADWDLLPSYLGLLGQLGAGDHDYRARAGELAARCGSRSAGFDLRVDPSDPSRMRGAVVLTVSGLAEHWRDQVSIAAETWRLQRWDETERIRELLAQQLDHLAAAVHDQGDSLACAAATRGIPGPAALSHRLHGLGHLAWLRAADPARLAEACLRFHQRLQAARPRVALIADHGVAVEHCAAVAEAWGGGVESGDLLVPASASPPSADAATAAWLVASPVNNVARAWSAPPPLDPSAPALALAVTHLSEVELHRGIREEGGAYGASMGYRPRLACTTATTYRDPELDRSLDLMQAACARLASTRLDPAALDAALLVAVAAVDAPQLPAGEARRDLVGRCLGWDAAAAASYRAGLFTADAEAVRRAAERWLGGAEHCAAVASERALDASQRSWERFRA